MKKAKKPAKRRKAPRLTKLIPCVHAWNTTSGLGLVAEPEMFPVEFCRYCGTLRISPLLYLSRSEKPASTPDEVVSAG